jgi:protein-tyrosine phosphatase
VIRSPGQRGRLLGLAALVCLSWAACSEPGPDPNLAAGPGPLVGRDETGRLLLRWQGLPADAIYRVYAGAAPNAIDRARALGEISAGRPELRLPPPLGESPWRAYLELVDGKGSRLVVAERRLPLSGAHNFRDLGGYTTRDGKRVRWGLLYRSDQLSKLDDRDVEHLSELGLQLVADFRGPSERENAPSRLPEVRSPRIEQLEIADESFDPKQLERRILGGDLDEVESAQLLVGANRAFATVYRDRYARLLHQLADPGNLPALFHCTAGKDRTGFGAAVELLALGVPEEAVRRDFMLSNVYSARHIERTLTGIRLVSLLRTDPEAVRPLLSVRPEYLAAALDATREQWGSFDGYLREGLGLDDETLARLRASLLE